MVAGLVSDVTQIREEVAAALKSGVDGVIGLRDQWGAVGPYLFTKEKELENLVIEPKFPLSKFIRRIIAKYPDKRIAAVVRGCDVRSLIEFEKRGIIKRSDVLTIGISCSQTQADICICDKPIYSVTDCSGCWKCLDSCPENAIERINACPIVIPKEFDMCLSSRKATHIPFPQAIPLKYSRDPMHCLKILGEMDCKGCFNVCQADAVLTDDSDKVETIEVGSVIVAPGFKPYDPDFVTGDYGYNRMPNVITSLEFERILSASGPFQGQVVRPSDGQHPVKVGWIQCVGSRKPEICKDYCSSVCCMYATKQAIIAREHDENIQPTIFYMDIRAFGKGYERYYQSAKEKFGVNYIKAMPTPMVRQKDNGNLVLEYTGDDGIKTYDEFDMMVLSVGLEPSESTKELAETLGLDVDQFGFCQTEELKPSETSRPGVYVAGVFSAPMDIPESVQNASSAAFLASQGIADARGTMVTEKQYPPEKDVEGQEPRIGVFVCRCGTNIARVVDVPSVAEYAKTLPNVVFADEAMYACSTDTQAKVASLIEEHNLNRIIVASCSPRTHEPLFQDTCRESGLNKYLFEMANIRDQCSWVHATHMPEATDKAQDLVRMAVSRAATLEPLHESPASLNRTGLIIGGGLAGMTAALGLAAEGFESVLIERQAELGGVLKDIYYTHDPNSDPQALLKDLKEQVEHELKITVHTNTEVKDVSGYVGNYKTVMRTPSGDESIEHGIAIVATGGVEYKPEGEYLFGQSDRVMTQHELEEHIAKGEVDASQLKSVVMIQCVGSREGDNMYCSRVCCTHAVKNALKLKESNPDLNIYVLYRDIRTYGMRELVYEEARKKGVLFIKYDIDRKPEVTEEDGQLRIKVYDPVLADDILIPADKLILSAAIRPQADAPEFSSKLKLPLNQDGFFMEAHMKLRPLDFVNEGMYMCGLAHSPKFVSETIAQARGAVSRAVTILSQPYLMTGGVVSVVNQGDCVACLTCVRACPFNVPKINENGVADIEQAACQGCGICASACPCNAISVQNYKDEQVWAKTAVLF
ncbi:FAD-dependent oxidoreductase [Chloroflexota bacterium]